MYGSCLIAGDVELLLWLLEGSRRSILACFDARRRLWTSSGGSTYVELVTLLFDACGCRAVRDFRYAWADGDLGYPIGLGMRGGFIFWASWKANW